MQCQRNWMSSAARRFHLSSQVLPMDSSVLYHASICAHSASAKAPQPDCHSLKSDDWETVGELVGEELDGLQIEPITTFPGNSQDACAHPTADRRGRTTGRRAQIRVVEAKRQTPQRDAADVPVVERRNVERTTARRASACSSLRSPRKRIFCQCEDH
jgi:hypothetical protein